MREAFVIVYWTNDNNFTWMIDSVTTSEDYAKDRAKHIETLDNIRMAGYENFELVEMLPEI